MKEKMGNKTELLYTYFNEYITVTFLQRQSLETPRFGKKGFPLILEKSNTGRQVRPK